MPADSDNPTFRPQLRAWGLGGMVFVAIGVGTVFLAGYFQASLGMSTAALAVLFAALPIGVVVPTFLWLDRFEAEPTRLLVLAFLWGAVVAVVIAGTLNTLAYAAMVPVAGGADARILTAAVVAPVVEEGAKGLLVLLVWRVHRREFDGITDGLVYAGVTAAGFAFTENIQYLGQAYLDGGADLLAGTFLARGVFTPFAHPIFTVLIGVGVGVASISRPGWRRVLAPAVGYLLAVVAHGLWNLGALAGGVGMLTVFVVVWVPVFLAFVAVVFWARAREGRLVGEHLWVYADSGWFAPAEVAMLASVRHRREARIWARANLGAAGLRAMRSFQDAGSELAFLRKRMGHTAPDGAELRTERELLTVVQHSRRALYSP